MGDVAFSLSLVATMMIGYFNRDDEYESLLSRFNEVFPDEMLYQERIDTTLAFIDECGFGEKSRIWKKADFFTAFIELNSLLNLAGRALEPSFVLESLCRFYDDVDQVSESRSQVAEVYYKSALQASNDRNNRLRRAAVVSGILLRQNQEAILSELRNKALI